MPKQSILVVEDEHDIRELLEFNLNREGFQAVGVETGDAAMRSIRESAPDLVLLDLMLPGMDGLEVCRRLKQSENTREIPIVILTAKGEESDIVTGLELGADDYITKPFSPRVVVARVKAVIRRRSEPIAGKDEVLNFSGLTIHPGRHEVLIDGKNVELTKTELQILHNLARRPGWVFTRYQLIDAIHGEKYAVSDRSVDVQVVGLRRKLGDCATLIETVRGVGYRFRVKELLGIG
ncbi:response regulator [bacterium]|nr:response regulator [bacterium]MBU1637796.1 response regulator [bacterium]MBU1920132.1 response regulator [bacterium]